MKIKGCFFDLQEPVSHRSWYLILVFERPLEFFLNGAEISLNLVNLGNLTNLKNGSCYHCLPDSVVASLSFTQEIAGSNTAIPVILWTFWSLHSLNLVKAFRENSTVSLKV